MTTYYLTQARPLTNYKVHNMTNQHAQQLTLVDFIKAERKALVARKENMKKSNDEAAEFMRTLHGTHASRRN